MARQPSTTTAGDQAAHVPHPGERIAVGRPICTVVAQAATPEDALAQLEEQAARLRAELAPRVGVAAGG